MIRALVLPVDGNPGPFVAALRQAGVPLRSFEERGQVVLATPDQRTADLVRQLHSAWERGERSWTDRLLVPEAGKRSPWESAWHSIRTGVRRYPAVAAVILIAVAVFPWVVTLADGQLNALSAALLIVDVRQGAEVSLARLVQDLEPWRWLTPVFIHFSFMHIAFNAAVIIEFGRRIEVAQGALGFWLLVVLTGVLSNLVQVQTGLGPLFGGLSGVGYGLLGFILVRRKLDPANPAWVMHPGVPLSLLIFLVLFSTGVTEPFGMQVANGAHWGGLVSGALLGLLAGRPASPGT